MLRGFRRNIDALSRAPSRLIHQVLRKVRYAKIIYTFDKPSIKMNKKKKEEGEGK
jgi:hypothetical protein